MMLKTTSDCAPAQGTGCPTVVEKCRAQAQLPLVVVGHLFCKKDNWIFVTILKVQIVLCHIDIGGGKSSQLHNSVQLNVKFYQT